MHQYFKWGTIIYIYTYSYYNTNNIVNTLNKIYV